jgi:hypothetical protein
VWAKQRVSVPRCSQLAGSPACCACDARSIVAQDVRTGDPGDNSPGSGECRPKGRSWHSNLPGIWPMSVETAGITMIVRSRLTTLVSWLSHNTFEHQFLARSRWIVRSKVTTLVSWLCRNTVEYQLLAQPRRAGPAGKWLDSLDVRKFAQILAALEAAEFYSEHLYNLPFFDGSWDHLHEMAKRATVLGSGAFLEFGVATGGTISVIAEAAHRNVVGFDWFMACQKVGWEA